MKKNLLNLLSVAFVLTVMVASNAIAQRPAPTPCASSPISLPEPYLGYNGYTNKTVALYAWSKDEPAAALQSYIGQLNTALNQAAAVYGTLTPECQAEVVRRKHELGVINELLAKR